MENALNDVAGGRKGGRRTYDFHWTMAAVRNVPRNWQNK